MPLTLSIPMEPSIKIISLSFNGWVSTKSFKFHPQVPIYLCRESATAIYFLGAVGFIYFGQMWNPKRMEAG